MKQELIVTLRKIDWLNGCNHGWGNGYIDLPNDHFFFGKDYVEINEYVFVHGGLTYSEMVGNNWRIGFDTAHYGDTLEKWSQWEVLIETLILKSQLEKYW